MELSGGSSGSTSKREAFEFASFARKGPTKPPYGLVDFLSSPYLLFR